MAAGVPERRMHIVRWVLTTAWLLIIASLFHDPWTPRFTAADHPWSPLRLTESCIPVQGVCLSEQPYPLGTTIFWGAVVPSAIFILLVFGHELWRRICPLSFLSQIPRALGLQRQTAKLNTKTGEKRWQLAKVPADSWLAKHYGALQFAWLFVGLCGRILFFNADRLVLAGWLLFTIAMAIAVGWLYGGKAWCQYFCPMAPVQSIYSTPTGLLGSKAHMSEQPITQSMCRTVLNDGSEQSACVACQQPCIDIDAERMYWARIDSPQFAFERYGYLGLVVGYFLYYYFYAGNWTYYFSGAWQRQSDQLSLLLKPGLYLFGHSIDLPRLVAVPLVLGLSTWLGWLVGRGVETALRARQRRGGREVSKPIVRHRVFVVATFLVFNFFFLFAGRPLLQLLPSAVQYLYDVLLVACSTLWLVRAWHRTPQEYDRENLASRFRKQLERLDLDVGRFLDGRSLRDLDTGEVYVLAKVLPGFTSGKRHEAYKGVVREALEEGYVNVSTSLDVLQQMRRELGISDDEHQQLLEELGVEDPSLLDPDHRRSLEVQIRLSGYRKALERVMLLQGRQGGPVPAGRDTGSVAGDAAFRALRSAYGIEPGEEEGLAAGLSPLESAARRAEVLLQRLAGQTDAFRALQQPSLREQPMLHSLLSDQIRFRKELMVRSILESLATLDQDERVPHLVGELQRVSPLILQELLEREDWRSRLPAPVFTALSEPGPVPAACDLELPLADTLHHLETLQQDRNTTIAAAALFLIAGLDTDRGRKLAGGLRGDSQPLLLRRTADCLLASKEARPALSACPDLEKRVVLASSDFFHRTYADTLDTLADQAEIRSYADGDVITEAGDTCRELLLLIDGAAAVHGGEGRDTRPEHLKPGQVLDELDVLTHSASETTIVAEKNGTRVLAIPVDSFDAMVDRDPDFARRVLELESRHLQQLMRAGSAGAIRS